GKSATCLIDYLSRSCQENQWTLTVADANADVLNKKLSALPAVQAAQVNVQNPPEWTPLIEKADLVISLLPPALHILIAQTCLLKLKNLLTASYIDAGIELLQKEIEAKGLLFLC